MARRRPGFLVVFHPAKGRPAVGMTDGDGRFSLLTFRQGDGALLGQHVVTVVVPLPGGSWLTMPGAAVIKSSRVPKQYTNPATSPLKASVNDGEKNDFTFDLKP